MAEGLFDYTRAVNLLRAAQYKEAVPAYTVVIRRHPAFPEAYNGRGLSYYNDDRVQQSLEDFNKAVELKPSYTQAIINRGHAQMQLGLYDAAIADYDLAIQQQSDNLTPYAARALARLMKGDDAGAEQDLSLAVSKGTDSLIMENLLAYGRVIRESGSLPQGTLADDAIDYGLAVRHLALGEYNEALTLLDNTIETFDKYPEAFVNRALTFSGLGQFERAIADFDEAFRLEPSLVDAYVIHRGEAYFRLANYEKALEDFSAMIAANPQDPRGYIDRAIAHALMGDDAAAQGNLARAVELGADRAALEARIEEEKSKRAAPPP